MSRSKILTAAICGAALFVCASANASVSFSQAELLGMKIDLADSVGYSAGFGTGILTANPTYEDGATPMQGQAGATGGLASGGVAYYSLSLLDLAAFNVAISSGTETLAVSGANDNNQTWDVGIWYKDTLGSIFTDFVTLVPGAAGGLSLALPAAVLDAGVAVRSGLSQPDNYHASWSVPEPTTIVVWTGLMGVCMLIGARRKHNS
jgi:hypothetical protein